MMGATINIGGRLSEEGTMIDMNATLGGRATTGKMRACRCGAVLGVIEPPSASPVVIDDNVLIGANAVILEGVHVGEGAIVVASAIVTQDARWCRRSRYPC